MKHSKKLVSADNHSNIFNFHYTYLVTLVPVCKDDLVLLPKRLAESLGNISRLAVAQRITSAIQFVDPLTAQTADVTEEKVGREAALALFLVVWHSSASRPILLPQSMLLCWFPRCLRKVRSWRTKSKASRLDLSASKALASALLSAP